MRRSTGSSFARSHANRSQHELLSEVLESGGAVSVLPQPNGLDPARYPFEASVRTDRASFPQQGAVTPAGGLARCFRASLARAEEVSGSLGRGRFRDQEAV
jgi:hypothetical protein